jgi:tetratricopeptide (TPR) repeat protein
MSKPMLVTMPFLLLLIDYWPLQRFSPLKIPRQILWEKIPFCLLAAASCLITLTVQHGAMPSAPFPLWFRLENAVLAANHYLSQTLWPDRLAIYYPFQKPSALTTVWLMSLVLFGIFLAAWSVRERNRCWLFGWLWFLGTLVPVLGIVQVGSAAMADRYLYIPSIGIFVAVSYGISGLIRKRPAAKNYVIGTAMAALVACVALTEKQLGYWKNTGTLFSHDLAVAGESDIARNCLGWDLENQGHYEAALAEYCQAVTFNPYEYKYHYQVGHVLEKLGRPAAALDEYRQCLDENQTNALYHAAAGNALVALGQLSDGLVEFDRAETLKSGFATPCIGAANALLKLGDPTNAVAKLWAAVRAEPGNFETLSIVARVMATYPDPAVRDGTNAVAIATKANEFAKGLQPAVLDVYGMAFAEIGDYTNAIACATGARELVDGGSPEIDRVDAKSIDLHLQSYRNRRPWREPFNATNTLDSF